MICDGDSKSYNAIWIVYGACDNLTKNSLHGETLKSTRHGKKTIFKERQSVRE